MVNPITYGEMPIDNASLLAPRKSASAPAINRTKPPKNNRNVIIFAVPYMGFLRCYQVSLDNIHYFSSGDTTIRDFIEILGWGGNLLVVESKWERGCAGGI